MINMSDLGNKEILQRLAADLDKEEDLNKENKMKNLNEKIQEWLEENNHNMEDFFCWLQGTEFPGSEVEYLGLSGQDKNLRWWTIVYESGHAEDFYLPF